MLRKHINRTETYLTQSHTIDGKKASYKHVLSYTCNKCLYHVHNATLESDSAATKSVVIGGYPDLGFDNDSYIRDLSVMITEPLTEEMAKALVEATVSIDAAVIAKGKAFKKTSEKYSLSKYRTELNTINELLSTVESPKTAELVAKYQKAADELEQSSETEKLSAEELVKKLEALDEIGVPYPFEVASFLKDTETGATALKAFKDYFADNADGIVITEVSAEKLRIESNLFAASVVVEEPSKEEYDSAVATMEDLECDQSLKDAVISSKCLFRASVQSKALANVKAPKTFILAMAAVVEKLTKENYLGTVVGQDFVLPKDFLADAKALKEKNDWGEGMGISIGYTEHEENDSFTGFLTNGLYNLGFGTEIAYVPPHCDTDEDINLWFSFMAAVNDIIMNTGFIFTAENAALTLNFSDSHVIFNIEDDESPAVISAVRPLK